MDTLKESDFLFHLYQRNKKEGQGEVPLLQRMEYRYTCFKRLLVQLCRLEETCLSASITEDERHKLYQTQLKELDELLKVVWESIQEKEQSDALVDETSNFQKYSQECLVPGEVFSLATAKEYRQFVEAHLGHMELIQKQLIVRREWMLGFVEKIPDPVRHRLLYQRGLEFFFDDVDFSVEKTDEFALSKQEKLSQLLQYLLLQQKLYNPNAVIMATLQLAGVETKLRFTSTNILECPAIPEQDKVAEQLDYSPIVSHDPATIDNQRLKYLIFVHEIIKRVNKVFEVSKAVTDIRKLVTDQYLDIGTITAQIIAGQQPEVRQKALDMLRQSELPFVHIGKPLAEHFSAVKSGYLRQVDSFTDFRSCGAKQERYTAEIAPGIRAVWVQFGAVHVGYVQM